MKCKEANILFEDYLKNKLDTDGFKMVDEHLLECELCRSGLNSLESLLRFIEEDRRIVINTSLYPGIINKLNEIRNDEKITGRISTVQSFLIAATIAFALISGSVAGYFTAKKYHFVNNVYSQYIPENDILGYENGTDMIDYILIKEN